MKTYRSRIYATYASQFQHQSPVFDRATARHAAQAFDEYFKSWLPENKEAQILDLGCGSGKWLYYLSDRGYHNLTGVDLSAEQVDLARQVTADVVVENALAFLPRNQQKFDLITAFDLIEHLQKDEVINFLDLAADSLRPGGRLILQTPNADSPWAASIRYADFTHEVGFTPALLEKLLTGAGFVSVDAREQAPIPFGYSVKSSIRWFGWRMIRTGLQIWNMVETGSPGSGIYTRVFCVAAVRR